MNPVQQTLLSVVVATLPTLAVVSIGILVNNKRADDLKDVFRAEMRRVEESLLHKFAELDDRLIRLENRYGK